MSVPTDELIAYLDTYLRIAEVPDEAGSRNGLQVEGGPAVGRIALAVDASERTIEEAAGWSADLLIVHHGLFWDGGVPLTGRRYRKVRRLIEGQVAVYSAHIPLDVHPEVGNNVVLARALGLEVEGWFGDYRGIPLGVWGVTDLRREALAARLDDVLGVRVRMMAGGPERLGRVGIITGGGGSMIGQAIGAGLDAYVTGEGAHHTYFDAVEGGINVYYGGHYATEVWGVRALGEHLRERYGVEARFIDGPTGL
jgi:dinuclear metal center YbgI/SA1388 family protein